MLLFFIGGVMNILWVSVIAIFVLFEKAAPFGRATGRGLGVLLIGIGGYVLASSFAV
jgi:predicted metal-binding membrane protein